MPGTLGNYDKHPQKITPPSIRCELHDQCKRQRAQQNSRSTPPKAPAPNLNNPHHMVDSTHRNNPASPTPGERNDSRYRPPHKEHSEVPNLNVQHPHRRTRHPTHLRRKHPRPPNRTTRRSHRRLSATPNPTPHPEVVGFTHTPKVVSEHDQAASKHHKPWTRMEPPTATRHPHR